MNELPLNRPVQPEAPPATAAFALWNLGFRPFYLLASIFSAISVFRRRADPTHRTPVRERRPGDYLDRPRLRPTLQVM
jgi:hypothetical protein